MLQNLVESVELSVDPIEELSSETLSLDTESITLNEFRSDILDTETTSHDVGQIVSEVNLGQEQFAGMASRGSLIMTLASGGAMPLGEFVNVIAAHAVESAGTQLAQKGVKSGLKNAVNGAEADSEKRSKSDEQRLMQKQRLEERRRELLAKRRVIEEIKARRERRRGESLSLVKEQEMEDSNSIFDGRSKASKAAGRQSLANAA